MTAEDKALAPCPWCGHAPEVWPKNPAEEGDAWGIVLCLNIECPAQPSVADGEPVSDGRGSDAYKAAAIARWNRRIDYKGDEP